MSGGDLHQRLQASAARWLRHPQSGPAYRSACSVVLTDLIAATRAVDRPEISQTECLSWQVAKGVFLVHHKRLMKAVEAERRKRKEREE